MRQLSCSGNKVCTRPIKFTPVLASWWSAWGSLRQAVCHGVPLWFRRSEDRAFPQGGARRGIWCRLQAVADGSGRALARTVSPRPWRHHRPRSSPAVGYRTPRLPNYDFRDDVRDIREQFPLDLDQTRGIAEAAGIYHPVDGKSRPILFGPPTWRSIRNAAARLSRWRGRSSRPRPCPSREQSRSRRSSRATGRRGV